MRLLVVVLLGVLVALLGVREATVERGAVDVLFSLAVGFAFTTSVAVVLYFDLRCRAENYDLELLAEQVEAGPGLGQR